MDRSTTALDQLSRRLIQASEESLRHWLDIPQLDYELLGTIYLRVREILERSPGPADTSTVEELALTIYLTASAWQSKSDAPVELLLSLHEVTARTLALSPSETTH